MKTIKDFFETYKKENWEELGNKERGLMIALWGLHPDDKYRVNFDIMGQERIDIGPVTLACIFESLQKTPEKNMVYIPGEDIPFIDISKIVWIEKI